MSGTTTTTITKKRKAAAVSTGKKSTKKSKAVEKTGPAKLVDSILTGAIENDIAAVKQQLIELAQYAKSLEQQLENGGKPVLDDGQRRVAGDALRSVIVRGIEKLMKWTPSCKHGHASFAYDGICQDRAVFGEALKLGGPPTFKTKKFPKAEFEDIFGSIQGSARYSYLAICGQNVNVHYKDDGSFKITGKYGVPGSDLRTGKDEILT